MPIPSSVYTEQWQSLSPGEKIAAFNAAGTTIDELSSAGVDQATIDWMQQNGFTPPSAESQIVRQIINEQEAATGTKPAKTIAQREEVVSQPTVPVVTEPESRITTALSEETEATTGRDPEVDRRAPRTAAEDFLMNIDPSFQQKLFKPGSEDRYLGTFVKTFKSVDGRLIPAEATPENIASGNLVFYVGGAPSGEYAGQNRIAQAYTIQNG
ncbi:MAG: hypothetical protein EB117_17790, partial [Betaproteobacteria bacterium]|nr:hypothetical protein [Betaproteobacteria bacterium]